MSVNYKPLTIYKASAGSGKTFTLAIEYINLLIANPHNFKYILAVTFTNKATQEMKQRILSQLYGIAHELPDSDSYFQRISELQPNLNEQEIRQHSADALQLIVHHYNLFRVETIDSFFQRILRNLSRELGLTANMQVSLNDTEVESQAVDNIIDNINREDDPLLNWIMDFVQERLAEDKSWNVIAQIKEFGKNIFKDFYRNHQQELHAIMNDPAFFKAYTSKLRTLKNNAIMGMAKYATTFKSIMENYRLTDKHFYQGKRGVIGYFEKLQKGDFLGVPTDTANKYVLAAIDNADALVKKDDINTAESQTIIREVGPLLRKAEEHRKEAAITVNSVELALKHINELRLLGRIEKEVQNINDENSLYPLSNTQKLLNSLIDEQDSPFIYEKIGGQLRYIMIDEFQDTSAMQWANFKVLLDDCIAHQNGSLIVGDVKQSIYRWRDGDWHLLNSLNEKTHVEIQVKHLNTNYRSQRNIIHFNNTFFSSAAQLLSLQVKNELNDAQLSEDILAGADEIKSAYEDVSQLIPADKQPCGLVRITLIPKDDYENRMVESVKDKLEYLLTNNIETNKIAILVRKNKHIKLLASYFQQNPILVNGKQMMINMVSDEAFRLDSSLAINIIITAMYVLTHPDDKLSLATLVKLSRSITPENSNIDDANLLAGKDKEQLKLLLPNEMVEAWDELLSTPLINLAERLFSIFELEQLNNQSAYICAFFDQMTDFLQKHVAGIDDFLKEWNNNLCGKSIHSDAVNGVRMLTIHKSKGLEFDHVIIPFCDWDLEDKRNILWMQTEYAPYNELPVIPVSLSAKKLKKSIFKHHYQNEYINNMVDNLNVMYVAFTRAGRNLFIIGKANDPGFPSKLLHDVIGSSCLSHEENNTTFLKKIGDCKLTEDEDGTIQFEYGNLCLSDMGKKKKSKNIFLQPEEGLPIKIQQNHSEPQFKQSNASKDFMTPDDELEEKQKRESYIETGNILHALLASIQNKNDIDRAIDLLEFDGVLYNKPMTRQQLKSYIEHELNDSQIAKWFSPEMKVFTECSILFYDTEIGQVRERRPDRVIYNNDEITVIDFKTGRKLVRHQEQVREYMSLLHDMGYKNISGYLWYIQQHNIVKVEL